MARANQELIAAIRRAAHNIENGAPYQWGHMGSCNCGNLAQELTRMSKKEIHEYAMRGKGDWNDQVTDYCANSGMPMDLLISQLLASGLSTEDLKNLERLSDPEVLQRFQLHERPYRKNDKEDVVKYMKTWADLLEDKLISKIDVHQLFANDKASKKPIAQNLMLEDNI